MGIGVDTALNTIISLVDMIRATAASHRRCFVGDRHPGLVRVGGVVPDLDVDLWLLTHADLRHSARVRAFIDFAGAELAFARNLIEGVTAEAA